MVVKVDLQCPSQDEPKMQGTPTFVCHEPFQSACAPLGFPGQKIPLKRVLKMKGVLA